MEDIKINPYSDEYFMKQALQEAQLAFEEDEVPVGCIIPRHDPCVN